MVLTKQAEFTKKVTDLIDNPSENLSPSEIKAYFDTPDEELKATINQLIDDLTNSGAKNIGVDAINGLSGSNIQDFITSLKTLVDKKTDNTGDFKGSWQGLTPQMIGAPEMNSARITAAESQLADFTNQNYFNSDLLFMTSWNGYLDGSQFEFYISDDGINYKNINKNSIFKSVNGDALDYQMFYKNGWFYVFFDQNNTMCFAKSQDLITWEESTLNLPGFSRRWGGKWFQDEDGSIHVFATMNTDFVSENDIDGTSIAKLDLYTMTPTDETLLNYTTPELVNLPDRANRIDAFVIKKDGVYHLFCKNDYNKTIEHYTKNTLDNSVQWQLLQTESFPFRVEAPAIVYFNGQYYFYTDCYESGFTFCKTSTDLVNWSSPFIAGAENGVTTRHFAPLVVSEQVTKETIKNFVISQQKKTVEELPELYVKNNKRVTNISIVLSRSGSVQVNNLLAIKGKVYRVTGAGYATINSFDTSKLKTGDEIYLSVQSSSDSAGITLKNSSSCITPAGEDFVITKQKGLNDEYVTLINESGLLRIKGSANMEHYYNSRQTEYARVDLSTLAVGGVINNLVLQNNTVYWLGSGVVTINSIDTSTISTNVPQMRGRVYFCVFSTSSSVSITLKNGDTSHIYLPGDVDYVISKASNNNQNMIPFTNHWTSLRMVR